jgi:hypothetical protein
MAAERHQAGIPLLDDRLGTLGLEAARGDDFSAITVSPLTLGSTMWR